MEKSRTTIESTRTTPPNTAPTSDQGGGGMAEKGSAAADAARSEKDRLAHTARQQADSLMHDVRNEARTQADAQTSRAAGRLRELEHQLEALKEGRSDEAGDVTRYLEQGREKIDALATRLEHGQSRAIVDDVVSFGRRRPGMFLLAAVGAGFAVGRIARAGSQDGNGSQPEAIDRAPMKTSEAAMPAPATPTPTDPVAPGRAAGRMDRP